MVAYLHNRILRLKDRGAVVISRAGGRHRKAVAGLKGAAAEGERGESSSGRSNKIRPTVAFAESYVLIVGSFSAPDNGRNETEYRLSHS